MEKLSIIFCHNEPLLLYTFCPEILYTEERLFLDNFSVASAILTRFAEIVVIYKRYVCVFHPIHFLSFLTLQGINQRAR